MNINKDILKLVDDNCWKYKFTITTNIKFNEHNTHKDNLDILNHWVLDKVIHFLNTVTKDIVKNKPKYKNSIQLKDLEKLSSHIMLFASFEPTQYRSGQFIHFHFLCSRFIVPKDNAYSDIIESIEHDVFNVFSKQLKNYKKTKFIMNYELLPYMPYKEFKILKKRNDVGDWRLYITKHMDNKDNHDRFPQFYSVKLLNILEQKGLDQ